MAERTPLISRQTIEASDWNHAHWLARYHELSNGPFLTEAHKDDFRGNAPNTAVDIAMTCLYTDLGDAADGRLEIPQELEVDQVEDWFIAQALGKGIRIHAEIIEMNERFRANE